MIVTMPAMLIVTGDDCEMDCAAAILIDHKNG